MIKAEDVARYMEERNYSHMLEPSISKMRSLEIILSGEPDVVSVRHASLIMGVHKNSVVKWIQEGYLQAFRWRDEYRIPKVELIRYMASMRFGRQGRSRFKGRQWRTPEEDGSE